MNIKMKKKELEMTSLEERRASGVWMFATAALVWALSVLSPSEWSAKTVSSIDEGAKVTEVTLPWTEVEQKKDTISLKDAIQWLDGEKTWISEEDEPGKEPDPEWWSRLWVHGFVQVWTSVVPDFAGIFSDKTSAMIGIDAKDSKTWLWLTVIRLDDFHTDPEYPLSRASVVVPYWTISSKDGKRSAWASVEFSFIDQLPETVWYTPVVVGTYSSDGWSIEWKYFHDFREWEDMDAVRLWITKKDIWDILSLTWQLWYKSDYVDKVYGRVIVDVSLWDWFWAQLSCIVRDWKLTPTMWVMYRF